MQAIGHADFASQRIDGIYTLSMMDELRHDLRMAARRLGLLPS